MYSIYCVERIFLSALLQLYPIYFHLFLLVIAQASLLLCACLYIHISLRKKLIGNVLSRSQTTSTIFFLDFSHEMIVSLSSVTSKWRASFFTSSLFALPCSGEDFIEMNISSPQTSMRPSEMNLTETEYRTMDG